MCIRDSITAADQLEMLYQGLKKRGICFYITEHIADLNEQMRKLGLGHIIEEGSARRTIHIACLLYTSGLYLLDVENRSRVEQEILQAELKNTFLTFMDVSKKGRGFTSFVFGMGQLSEEGIAKKIAEQISAIAFTMPHKFHMDREFAVLQKAALEAFRQQYPEREHFLMK